MHNPTLTMNLEKIMAVVVALLFAAVSTLMILLYSNSKNILTENIEINSVLAREEVK